MCDRVSQSGSPGFIFHFLFPCTGPGGIEVRYEFDLETQYQTSTILRYEELTRPTFTNNNMSMDLPLISIACLDVQSGYA